MILPGEVAPYLPSVRPSFVAEKMDDGTISVTFDPPLTTDEQTALTDILNDLSARDGLRSPRIRHADITILRAYYKAAAADDPLAALIRVVSALV